MAAEMQPSNQPVTEPKFYDQQAQWEKVREALKNQIKPLIDKYEAENPKKLQSAEMLSIEGRYLYLAAFYRLPQVLQEILDIYKKFLSENDFQNAINEVNGPIWGHNKYCQAKVSPLHCAVYNMYEGSPLPEGTEQVTEILLKAKVDLVPRDENGRTPLHHAARSASSTLINLILRYTSEKDKKHILENLDDCGMTPLMVLLTRGITWNKEENGLAALDALIKAGANVNNPNKETYMPPRNIMDRNLARRDTPWTVYPLHYAAMHGNTPKYLVKLIAAGARLWNTESEKQQTALDFAFEEGRIENARALISFGLTGDHKLQEHCKRVDLDLYKVMIVVQQLDSCLDLSKIYRAIKKAYVEQTKDKDFSEAAQSPALILEMLAKEFKNVLQQAPLVNNAITALLTQDIKDNANKVATLIANGQGKEALELQLKLHTAILPSKDNIKNVICTAIAMQTLLAISPKLILPCYNKLQTMISALLKTETSSKAEADNLGLSPSSNVVLSDEAIIASSVDARGLEASKKESQDVLDISVVFTLSPQAKAVATAGLLPKQENSASAPATDLQTPALQRKSSKS